MRATSPGPAFLALIAPVLDAAGPLPHARLEADREALAAAQDAGTLRSPPAPASRPTGTSNASAPPAATSFAPRANGSTRSDRLTAPGMGRCWRRQLRSSGPSRIRGRHCDRRGKRGAKHLVRFLVRPAGGDVDGSGRSSPRRLPAAAARSGGQGRRRLAPGPDPRTATRSRRLAASMASTGSTGRTRPLPAASTAALSCWAPNVMRSLLASFVRC